MSTYDGRTSRSPSAANYAPSEYDTDESLHTIDDVDDGDDSDYEDCIDDGRDEATDGGRPAAIGSGLIDPYSQTRRRYVDIGDEDITFIDRYAARTDARENYVTNADRGTSGHRVAMPNRPNRVAGHDQNSTTLRRRVAPTTDSRNEPIESSRRRHTAPIEDRLSTSGGRDPSEGRRGVTFAENETYRREQRVSDDDHHRRDFYDESDYTRDRPRGAYVSQRRQRSGLCDERRDVRARRRTDEDETTDSYREDDREYSDNSIGRRRSRRRSPNAAGDSDRTKSRGLR